jgi:hypothetical protein
MEESVRVRTSCWCSRHDVRSSRPPASSAFAAASTNCMPKSFSCCRARAGCLTKCPAELSWEGICHVGDCRRKPCQVSMKTTFVDEGTKLIRFEKLRD